MRNFGILAIICLFLWGCNSKAQNGQNDSRLAKNSKFSVHKTEAQWRKELTPEQYHILRERGTEPRFSSPVLDIKKPGVLVCAACGNPVFYVKHKFKSKCGWPSFDRAIKGAVVYRMDYRHGMARTEVLCARCGGHLGHLFDDGPVATTGERYCIDGVALKFIPLKKFKKKNHEKEQ